MLQRRLGRLPCRSEWPLCLHSLILCSRDKQYSTTLYSISLPATLFATTPAHGPSSWLLSPMTIRLAPLAPKASYLFTGSHFSFAWLSSHMASLTTHDLYMDGPMKALSTATWTLHHPPSSSTCSLVVDDIAASKDILGEIITHHCRTFTIAARVQIGIRRCWYHLAAGSRSLRACLYSSASDSLGLSSVGFWVAPAICLEWSPLALRPWPFIIVDWRPDGKQELPHQGGRAVRDLGRADSLEGC